MRSGFGLIMPALPLYVRLHHLPVSVLGLAAAMYMGLGIVGMLVLAPFADRFGPVRSLVAGGVLYLLGSILLIAVPSEASLMAGRAFQGLAMALTTPATFAYVGLTVPRERRGAAFGLIASCQMSGFILGPAAGGLALTVGGFAGPFTAAVAASILALAAYAVLPRARAQEATADAAEPAALFGVAALRAPLAAMLAVPWGLGFIAYTIGQQIPAGVYDTVWSLFMFHLGAAPWLVGASYAAWALPLVFLSPLLGGRVPAERVAPWLVIGGMVTALAAATYGFLHSGYAVAAVGFLEGTGSAAITPLTQVYLAHRVPTHRMAAAQGVAGGIGQGAALVAAVVSGYSFTVAPWLPFAIVAACAAVGTLWFSRSERAWGAVSDAPGAGLGA